MSVMQFRIEDIRVRIPLYYGADSFTPDEPWTPARSDEGHWYQTGSDFARSVLSPASGECLVIGSPLFEADELRADGWNVTYLDIRKPALPDGIRYVSGDARAIPFPDGYFDAVSSTCVMCHVGLGRYGDKVDDDGDMTMLGQIARVLKPNGRAALMLGQVADIEKNQVQILGTLHRLYPLGGAQWMAERFGLRVVQEKLFETRVDGKLTASHICVELAKAIV